MVVYRDIMGLSGRPADRVFMIATHVLTNAAS